MLLRGPREERSEMDARDVVYILLAAIAFAMGWACRREWDAGSRARDACQELRRRMGVEAGDDTR